MVIPNANVFVSRKLLSQIVNMRNWVEEKRRVSKNFSGNSNFTK